MKICCSTDFEATIASCSHALSAMILAAFTSVALPSFAAEPAAKVQINQPPKLRDWQALAKLPDFGGIWTPVISDQVDQERTNPPPWNAQAAKQIAHMYSEEEAGRPFPVIDHCFPTGMPSYTVVMSRNCTLPEANPHPSWR
jgi:hypothetical protein